MKKNLMSVIILALLVVNLVLTGVLMFTIYPQTKAANQLITSVCNAIQLDLNSGAATGLANLPIEQIATYEVNAGEVMTINLKKGEDKKEHWAVIKVSISVNNKSDAYVEEELNRLSSKESIVKETITDVVRQYTKEEFDEDTNAVKKEILKRLQNSFGADYVVGVAFPEITTD